MKYEDFYKKLNFTKLNNCYYLNKDGYLFYLKDYESVLTIKSFYVTLNEEIKKEHLKEFTLAAFENVCFAKTNESNNDTLIITLPSSAKVNEGFINSCLNVINAITKKLKELGYTPKTRCLYCHDEAEYNTFNDEYLPLHNECKEKIKEEYQQKLDKQNKEKYRYLISLAFSLMIACLAFFVNYFITYYSNMIITPLLLLITFGSFFGLHLSNAKNDKISYLITFIISINFVALFNFLAFSHLANIKELTFLQYLNQNTWHFIRKILFSILFIFAGFRIYKMFFAKKHPNFEKLIKNI